MFFHSGELKTFSICASVMSSLRSPRVQLLHISQRASQTNVHVEDQDGRVEGRDSADVAVDEVAGGTESSFCEVLGRVDLRHK